MTTMTITEMKETKRERVIKTYDDLEGSKNVDDIITCIMIKVGVRPHITGYYYLKRAIALVVEDPKNGAYMTKNLYYRIAEEFDTTWVAVERSMRSAVQSICCSDDDKEKYIGYAEKSYTCSKFIAAVAELVRYNVT